MCQDLEFGKWIINTGIVKNMLLLNPVLFQATDWLQISLSTSTAGNGSSSIDFNTIDYKFP